MQPLQPLPQHKAIELGLSRISFVSAHQHSSSLSSSKLLETLPLSEGPLVPTPQSMNSPWGAPRCLSPGWIFPETHFLTPKCIRDHPRGCRWHRAGWFGRASSKEKETGVSKKGWKNVPSSPLVELNHMYICKAQRKGTAPPAHGREQSPISEIPKSRCLNAGTI